MIGFVLTRFIEQIPSLCYLLSYYCLQILLRLISDNKVIDSVEEDFYTMCYLLSYYCLQILLRLISDNKVIDPVEEDFYTMENVIEKTWSVIWTLTDEVPSNCERFVKYKGLEISKEIMEVNAFV